MTAPMLRFVPDRDPVIHAIEQSITYYRLIHRYRRACRSIGERSEKAKACHDLKQFGPRLKKYENAVKVAARVERELLDYLRSSL